MLSRDPESYIIYIMLPGKITVNNRSLTNMGQYTSLISYHNIVSTMNSSVTTKYEKDLKIKSTPSPFQNSFMLRNYPVQNERLWNFSNLQRGVKKNEHTAYYWLFMRQPKKHKTIIIVQTLLYDSTYKMFTHIITPDFGLALQHEIYNNLFGFWQVPSGKGKFF